MKRTSSLSKSPPYSLLISGLALWLCALTMPAQPVLTYIWSPPNGSDNRWDNPANWSPFGVPGTNDAAEIYGGSADATVIGNSAVYEVDLHGGALSAAGLVVHVLSQTGGTLAGSISIDGPSTWTSGYWNNTTVTVSSNGVLNIVSGNDHDLANSILTNYGTVIWRAGRVRGGGWSPGAQIFNYGLWDAQCDQAFNGSDYGGYGMVFNNSGAFRKSAGTGTTTIPGGVTFNTSGTVDVETGTLALTGYGGGNGPLHIAQGAGIYFSGNYSFSGDLFTGNGNIALAGGSLTLNGSITSTNLQQTGGALSGQWAINGSFTWTSGNWNNSTITISSNSVLIIDSGNDHDLANSVLTNYGTVVWRAGRVRGGGGVLGRRFTTTVYGMRCVIR